MNVLHFAINNFDVTINQTPVKTATFPWIQKFASIGDSYSAGLGSGGRLDWSCSRYAQSYPHLLQSSLLGSDSKRTHQFLSCSGATSTEILKDQVSALHEDLDLLTVSAGGNDIGLTPILSNCVYQFYMSAEDACQQAMDQARANINNATQLYKNVTDLLEAAKPKMNKDHGVIYYTGYAGFFGTDDETCDNVTWAVWRNLEWSKQYLTLSMRKDLNQMVRSVNDIIRKAVTAAGPNVRFIDYDAQIAATRGRYCEAGVDEPAPNRRELAFYEWNTVDTGENKKKLQNRTGDDVPKGSFQGGIAKEIKKTLEEHPDWQFDPEKGFVNKTRGVNEQGAIEDAIHWLLPDSYKRVFHLRPKGHWIVAEMVVQDLLKRGHGQRVAEVVDEL
ncbi:SGNH hydrolase [Plenodomus tracheiphilus IPT5]|uniref:SGNH hydrolase n=1 Tax=Plenodomus tracheiphilus IPT5 TaxID=1408161 RepID=A0A6A7BJF7_9PLEO|nr:SGNH hydrolase [Plenodomus tracheiphilus IPT5]